MQSTSPVDSLRGTVSAALTLALVLALLTSHSFAQTRPLEALLPSTTVAAFYVGPTSGDLGVLEDALAGLDTDTATDTLQRLMLLIDGEAFDLDGELDLGGMLRDEIALECPAIEAVWDDDATSGLFGPGVLAISVSPFNPLPGVIALLRPADAGYAGALQDTLLGCLPAGPTFTQDDVTLYVIGDGSDLPLVVARIDDTFVAATDPDLVRAAVRLARGSDEPNHLDTVVGASASALMDGGLGVSVDFGALAAGLQSITGMLVGDPAEAAVLDRALESLASLGGMAGRLTIDQAGLRFDGFAAPDATAGDAALAALVACEDCSVGVGALLPAGAVSTGGWYVDLRAGVAYLDGWLADLAPLIGEELDVRSLAREGGLDLDALLLDWIGDRWHTAQLDVLGTDLRSWIVGPGTVMTVPVASEAAALAGLAGWRALLEGDGAPMAAGAIDELMFMVDPFGPGASGLFPEGGLLSVREMTYRGVAFERWRVGPTTDVGFAVIDSHLVAAMPASALHAVIDVHLGADAVLADAVLGPQLRALPGNAVAFEVADPSRQLHALADFSDMLAAPLATGARLAIQEALSDPWGDPWGDSWDDDPWGMEPGGISGLWRSSDRYGADLMNEAPYVQSLTVPGFMRGPIRESDVLPNGDYGLVFEVQNLVVGSTVMVEMIDASQSWDMDTYLYLYDVGAGRVIADDDDSPDTNRSELVFVVEPGVSYAVIASSWGGNDVGEVILESEVLSYADDTAPDADAETPLDEPLEDVVNDELDVPTFAELVALFDLVTDGLRAVAERVDTSTSLTIVEDGVRRTTWTLPLR
ncbi:MAG: hypothetical protein EA416_09675 [Trueperaceae bacterium]|nr:MAG: hypothetical protein EA416_09675 [Trueperaceae bacterium]